MKNYETIIVGGGPAGSSCAWKLINEGKEALVLDKQTFPRLKLCAGWITAKVMEDLQFTTKDYPHPISELNTRIHFPFLPFSLSWFPTRWSNFSIRRIEFDQWLLERCRAPVIQHHVKKIEKVDGRFIIDGQYVCKNLVGAGGTMCPVRRIFFPDVHSKERQIATLEHEFEYPARQDVCHLFFFYRGLKGYAWYVPKGKGYVNIGLGGMSRYFKESATNIHDHYRLFLEDLVKENLLDSKIAEQIKDKGHPYFLFSNQGNVKKERCFLIGDSAGLASVDLGEGIGPAVESGLLAAGEIIGTATYHKEQTSQFSLGGVLHWILEHWASPAKSKPQNEQV